MDRIPAFDRVPGFAPLSVEFEERSRRIDRRLTRRLGDFLRRRNEENERATKKSCEETWSLQIRGARPAQVALTGTRPSEFVIDEPPYKAIRQAED